jgi:eukaryotic-like serine/threonine-protein kinase
MLEAGVRLGPYEILALHGAGGMGEVYRARDTRLNRTVALKVVSPAWSNSEEGRQRFEREARVVSQISHPNVCTLFDVGRADDREFLVMEFVEGVTLQARLERGPLPQQDVIGLGQAIASGLDAAHREGVVHRDLKPGNIILSRNGVKILDFGLARTLTDEPSGGDETRGFNTGMAGAVLGTLPYMAPEQLQGGRVDARTDVFALGAVLYEMATGRRAFDATSQAGIIAALRQVATEMKLHAAIPEFFSAFDSGARVAELYAVTDARLQTLTLGFRSAIADPSLLIY